MSFASNADYDPGALEESLSEASLTDDDCSDSDGEFDDEVIFETPIADAENDLEAARREEFESVKAIYGDDDIKYKEWEGRLGFTIRFGKVSVEVVTTPGYPATPPLHISV